VDADACPFKEDILEVAEQARVRVVFVVSANHQMPEAPHAETVVVDHKDADAADFAVFNCARRGDVAITQDSGLAAMLLGRGVCVLTPRGAVWNGATIGAALERRHAIRSLKRRGRHPRGGGAPALCEGDRARLRQALERELGLEREAD